MTDNPSTDDDPYRSPQSGGALPAPGRSTTSTMVLGAILGALFSTVLWPVLPWVFMRFGSARLTVAALALISIGFPIAGAVILLKVRRSLK